MKTAFKLSLFGGRGASSASSSAGGASFSPQKKDEVTEKLSDKILSLGTKTITIKDENGKTRGMVREISRVSTTNPSDQMLMHKIRQESGVDIRKFGTENIYKSGKSIYIFNNTKTDYIYPKLKNTNKEEYNRFLDKKKKLRKAEQAGVYIINYKKY